MPCETDVGSKFWIHKQWSEAKTGWQWFRDLSTTMPFYLTNDWINVSDEESIYKIDLTFLHNPLNKTMLIISLILLQGLRGNILTLYSTIQQLFRVSKQKCI